MTFNCQELLFKLHYALVLDIPCFGVLTCRSKSNNFNVPYSMIIYWISCVNLVKQTVNTEREIDSAVQNWTILMWCTAWLSANSPLWIWSNTHLLLYTQLRLFWRAVAPFQGRTIRMCRTEQLFSKLYELFWSNVRRTHWLRTRVQYRSNSGHLEYAVRYTFVLNCT